MNRKNRLRAFRRAKDLTQFELAKKIGISRPMVSFIENRNYSPDNQLKEKIAKVLGRSCRTIFPG